MRVLVFHSDYRQPGGETKSVLAEVAHLRAAGDEVRLALAATPQSFTLKDTAEIVMSGAESRSAALGEIAAFAPDIIHVQNVWPMWGHGLVDAIATAGVPYVQTLRNYRWSCLSANHFRDGGPCHSCGKAATAVAGVFHGCYRGSRIASAGLAMHDAKMRMSRRRAGGAPKALIALSLAMRDELLQSSSGLPPVHVKYNSLEVDPGLGTHHGAAKTGYIWVGRLEAEKGFDLVVRTWRSWENPPPLTIVGDGKLADQARELSLASPHVEWTPRMEHQQVMTAIAEHRVSLITPLWSEPFGRVALESLAVGTPVVHTGKGALDELVGASGWKLDLRGDLRAQLSDFYEQAQATTGRARARYEGVLSPSATTKVLQSIYRTALEPGVH